MKNGILQSPMAAGALLVIVMAALFVQLGGVPLFDEDEGAYAEVSREMAVSGDWLVPYLEGKPFFHKPPLIYWTQIISIKLLGVNEFALRLPSALASLAWALILYGFVRRYIGARPAWLAVFFLVTALQTSIISKAAIPDALLNLFITVTMLALYVHYQTERRRWLLIAYAGMALGFMTKGPIAVAIPVVVSAFFYLFEKKFKTWLRIAFWPPGWVVFLLIAAPWYVVLSLTFGMNFVGDFFMIHNVGRFRNAMEGHSGPIYYYIPVIIAGLLPYTTIVLVALAGLRRHWRSDLGRWLVLWFAFVLVFFSLAETKLQHYIVYGYVPLLIFMAQAGERLKRPVALLAPVAIFALIVLLIPFIAAAVAPAVDDDFARIVIKGALDEFGSGHYLVMGILLALIVGLAFIKPLHLLGKTVIAGLLFLGLINFYLMPKVADIMQGPIKTAALLAKQRGYDVVMYQMNYPSFSVYLEKPVEHRPPRAGDVIITKANKLSKIESHTILYQKHGFVLAEVIRP